MNGLEKVFMPDNRLHNHADALLLQTRILSHESSKALSNFYMQGHGQL